MLAYGDKVRAKGTLWVEHRRKWWHAPVWRRAKRGVVLKHERSYYDNIPVVNFVVVLTRWGLTEVNPLALERYGETSYDISACDRP
jgi:hypothetical protein